MKKMLLLVCILLCTVFSAFAAEMTFSGTVAPIKIEEAGEHTVILNGVTIIGYIEETYIYTTPLSASDPAEKVTIILKDGTTNSLTAQYETSAIFSACDLVIRCERAGEGHTCDDNCGKLIAIGADYGAGISISSFGSTLTIEGGVIEAYGGYSAAGIGGGGWSPVSSSLIIKGGIVKAVGGGAAAGIGSSENAFRGTILIQGGDVTANGDSCAAGIGSGEFGKMAGDIIIEGGTVKATGGYYGAGIGSGNHGEMSGTVTITGGTVTAIGDDRSAGIGGGNESNMSGKITIKGGNVFATGGLYDRWEESDIILNALGAGYGGEITDEAVIEVDPDNCIIEVKKGADKDNAAELEGSPYDAATNLTSKFEGSNYAQFRALPIPATPAPATPVPSPTPAPDPEVPQTGDGMNAALTAVLMAMGLLGMAMILRRKNEA